MNRILYLMLSILLFTPSVLNAQKNIKDPNKMWTVPAIYTMDEELTWYFDFTDADLVDGEDLYLWIWSPNNPTGEPILMHADGDKIWSFTFTPTTLFKMTVDQLLKHPEPYYFLIRDLDGTKLTGTLSIPIVNWVKDFTESQKVFDFAPNDFQLGSTLSLIFNSNLVEGFNPVPSTVHLHSGLNDWDVKQEFQAWLPEIREKTQLKHIGGGIYKKDFVPLDYYGADEEYSMERINFLVVKYNGNDASPDWAGASPDYEILAPDTPEPPAPKFYVFPQKFTKEDILTLVRTNNEKGLGGIEYTIKAEGKVIKGELTGTLKEMKAHINLLAELKDMSPKLEKISLEVKSKSGLEIIKTDIPLVALDN